MKLFSTLFICGVVFACHREVRAQAPPLATQTISLPSGPGSIEGLGESFDPQLNTGSYVFRLPFKLPAVRGRAQPEVAMTYHSGNGNGPLGLGWSLTIPSIQRQTDKGLPTYGSADRFITGEGEELTARADGSFRRKVETDFTRWEFLGAQGWKGTRRDGTVLRLGASLQARQERATGQVFRWMIESAQDPNGNRVEYTYQKHGGQIYPAEIRYGLHESLPSNYFRVVFEYDEDRPDPLADYRGRFKALTALRLRSVSAWLGERRVRFWRLDYHENRPLTQLARFTMFGDERAATGASATLNEDFLPPVEFDYSPSVIGASFAFHQPITQSMISFGNGEARLTDLNRDGLPDVLLYSDGRYHSMVNRGQSLGFGPLTAFSSQIEYTPLSSAGLRLADLRGDGTLKVLARDGFGSFYREFTSATTLGPAVDFEMGDFSLETNDVQTVDIDNDRAMDFMTVDVDRFSFWINGGGDGPNFFYETDPSAVAQNVRFRDGWQLADLNGDRMPDLAAVETVNAGGVVFYPGKGWGEFDSAQLIQGGPTDADLTLRGRGGLSLVDIDGDGLADIVLVDSGVVKVWPNRSGKSWGGPVVIRDAQIPTWNEGGTTVQFLDMNGNGSTDIVWNDPGQGLFIRYLELQPGSKPNVMTRMRNGMGRELQLEYRSSVDYMTEAEGAGQAWTSKPPFPVPVVSAFTERDGFGSTYRSEITYRNGYYDGLEREFRGFERAVQTEIGNSGQGAPSLVSEFRFDTGAQVEALKGLRLFSELRTSGGHVFQRTESTWGHRSLGGAPAIGETRSVIFAFQRSETTTVIEGGAGSPVVLLKEFEFDDYGNQTLVADYGRVEDADRGAWQDERITRRTFSAARAENLSKWMLDYPVTERIEAFDGAVAAETRYFYDDPSFSGSSPGALSRGNPTLVRRLADSASGRFLNAERKTYDGYGNPTDFIDPLGSAPGDRHSRRITYDSSIHTHPVSETIFIGGNVNSVTLNADYDLGLGVLTESRDFNGHATLYRFDPFGRINAIIKPGDSLAAPTESYDYRFGIGISGGRTINWIETRKRETSGGGTLDSRMFFDGLSRKIMRREEGEDTGQIVVTDTVIFNDRRKEWKTYLPYFDTGSLDFKDPAFSTPFQEHHYDALGRPTVVYQPDTGNGRAFSRVTYAPLARLQQDEEQTRTTSPHFGCGMRYIEDGLRDDKGAGRLRTVEEIVKLAETGEPAAAPVTWTTRYRYDTLGNFTGYTDSKGNQKHFLYDAINRRVFMDDPDRGHYWWAYDDAGNVLRTCDAKGQHLAFAYDGANRIAAEWHLPSGAGGPSPLPGAPWSDAPAPPARAPEVSYHYDVAAGPIAREAFWRPLEVVGLAQVVLDRLPTAKGADLNNDGAVDARDLALKSSTPAVGESVHSQNALGRLAWVQDQVGEEHLSYDARGRTVWKVKRLYNGEGDGMLSFFVENQFDSMDRLTRHVYADGTSVDYRFNPRGLLESVAAAIDRVDYNPAGQNLRIDLANGVRSTFSYDPRLRVTRISSVRTSDGTALQDREFGYDDISNIAAIGDRRTAAHRSKILAELPQPPELAAADLNDSFTTITYDSLYRVTLASGPAQGSHAYRFDPIGNLISQTYQGDQRFRPTDMGTMSYGENGRGPHVLTSLSSTAGGKVFSYDNNGNLAGDGAGATLTWDPKDRLSGASEDGSIHQYRYDHASKRSIHAVTKGGQTRLTYYIDDVSEYRDGRLVKYIYVGSEKVARSDFSREPGQSIAPDLFYLHDHLGSTTMAMDREGKPRQISSYSPYGHNRFKNLPGTKAVDYGFSGKELHDSPDLAYFETRFLSSGLARFTQADTLTLNPPDDWRSYPQKWHPYSYCWGNPVTMVDKDGRNANSAADKINGTWSLGVDGSFDEFLWGAKKAEENGFGGSIKHGGYSAKITNDGFLFGGYANRQENGYQFGDSGSRTQIMVGAELLSASGQVNASGVKFEACAVKWDVSVNQEISTKYGTISCGTTVEGCFGFAANLSKDKFGIGPVSVGPSCSVPPSFINNVYTDTKQSIYDTMYQWHQEMVDRLMSGRGF